MTIPINYITIKFYDSYIQAPEANLLLKVFSHLFFSHLLFIEVYMIV